MTDTTVTPRNADAAIKAIRYAVRSLRTWADYVAENNVTRETVKDHAAALAALAYPTDKPVQKVDGTRTRFGNAVQAAGNGMRRALETDDDTDGTEAPVNLLTRAGLKAELAEVIAAWEAAQNNN